MDALQTQTVNSTTAPQPNYIPGLIAVVGCDGTGKSTLTTDLVKSLQQHWQTERRYLGLLSGEDGDKIKRLPLVGVWLERRLAAKSSKTQSMKTKSPALWAAVIMYCFSLRRMANLRKVQRLAQSGVLVVSDRFPQAEISGFYYDTLRSLDPENKEALQISRFLAAINGLMGDKHDDMVADDMENRQSYDAPVALDSDIRQRLELLISRFPL
ncbi:hypothetical protein C5B22_000402 [Escherichia coli O157:H7]|nr:hypothetical protein [Escherichia coli O157:H7]